MPVISGERRDVKDEKDRTAHSGWKLDVLKTAVIYGADAVYIGRRSLRTESESKEFYQRRDSRRNRLCP